MIFNKLLVTKYLAINVDCVTDKLTHSIITDYQSDIKAIIDKSTDYMNGLLLNWEQEKAIELKEKYKQYFSNLENL